MKMQLEENQPSFGKLVQAYRKQRGWTQDELAQKWGYTREYVSQIERNKRKLDRTDQVVNIHKTIGGDLKPFKVLIDT